MIREKVLEGLPLDDMFIFDCHGHIQPSATFNMPDCDGAGMIQTMDRLGVNAIGLTSTFAFSSDVNLGNEDLLRTVQAYPGRLYGYFTPSPYVECYPEKYLVDGNGFVGVKIHANGQRTVIDDARYARTLEIADQKGMPVLVHTWSNDEVKRIEKIAKQFPNANFIIAHSAMLEFRDACVDACHRYENIYCDTALSTSFEGTIEYMVNKIGADKLLYGSDCAFFDCCQTFGKIGLANISDEDKIKIYGENAKRIFKL